MSKKSSRKECLGLLLGSLIVSMTCNQRPPNHPYAKDLKTNQWAMNSLWDDGLAEVANYQTTRHVYGVPRIFESILITVKEDFTPQYYVKADVPSAVNSLTVFKLNIVATIPTENYNYHYLTSIFVSRKNPIHLIKLTNTSQEWCGNTFKEIRNWNGLFQFIFHSYFDGEGDGSLDLDFRIGDLLEDQLALTLRSLPFEEGYCWDTRIMDSLVTNRIQPLPQWRNAQISILGLEALGDRRTWNVSVQRDGLSQHFWFDEIYPHIMVQFTSSDGRELKLKNLSRRKYW
mgnify:CR=1 FL=1